MCMLIQKLKYAAMKERHSDIMRKHEETTRACEAVKAGRWTEAADLFYSAADAKRLIRRGPTCVSAQQGYHVVFVLDESGSMVHTAWYGM